MTVDTGHRHPLSGDPVPAVQRLHTPLPRRAGNQVRPGGALPARKAGLARPPAEAPNKTYGLVLLGLNRLICQGQGGG